LANIFDNYEVCEMPAGKKRYNSFRSQQASDLSNLLAEGKPSEEEPE
jgi:hypothetical protein